MRNCAHGDGFCLTCSQLEDARNLIASYEYDKLPALLSQVEALKARAEAAYAEGVTHTEARASKRIAELEAIAEKVLDPEYMKGLTADGVLMATVKRLKAAESESTRLKAELFGANEAVRIREAQLVAMTKDRDMAVSEATGQERRAENAEERETRLREREKGLVEALRLADFWIEATVGYGFRATKDGINVSMDREKIKHYIKPAALSAEPERISITAALNHECPAPGCSGQPCKWDGKNYGADGKEQP